MELCQEGLLPHDLLGRHREAVGARLAAFGAHVCRACLLVRPWLCKPPFSDWPNFQRCHALLREQVSCILATARFVSFVVPMHSQLGALRTRTPWSHREVRFSAHSVCLDRADFAQSHVIARLEHPGCCHRSCSVFFAACMQPHGAHQTPRSSSLHRGTARARYLTRGSPRRR